jgi:hypothetical protein
VIHEGHTARDVEVCSSPVRVHLIHSPVRGHAYEAISH